MQRYNLNFPDHVNEVSIELWCYRNNHTPDKGGLGKAGHMKEAIKLLWPEQMPNGERGYVFSEWSDRRIEAWCNDEFHEGDADWQTWWGPSSSGKSTDAGIIVLTHWLSAPSETTAIVCSTTKDMLLKRIFGEIVRYHSLYQKQLPGVYSKSKNAILLGDENSKNGIFGIAIQKGTVKEAMGNLVGVHNMYNVLVVDEMQATRAVAMDATDNLSTGKEFKFLGMGNPESRLDPLGVYSEPKKGWESITTEDISWETNFGKTLYFDGLKSPAIKEPDKFYFLLSQKQIDDLRRRRGEDSPAFWSQRRGFVPPEGLTQTVLTESAIVKYKVMGVPEWVDTFQIYAGIDPAYSSGGDRCIMQPAAVGKFTNGMIGIALLKTIVINLRLSEKVPMTYYLQEQIQKHAEDLGIGAAQIGIDVTGMQGILVDVIEKEWERGIYRVNFVGNPTDLPASADDKRKASEVYKYRVTELWFNVAEFARHDQLRGMEVETAKEFVSRQLMEKDLAKIWVEPKPIMKSRTGESPDRGDATACVISLIRERLGIHPGASIIPPKATENDDLYREYDVDGAQSLYLTNNT